MVVCKIEAQLEYTVYTSYTVYVHIFFFVPICKLRRCLLTKFLQLEGHSECELLVGKDGV